MVSRHLVLALSLLAGACSLMVDGEQAPLRCSEHGRVGPPACDEGFVCQRGVCEVWEPVSSAGAPADFTAGADAASGQGGEESGAGRPRN